LDNEVGRRDGEWEERWRVVEERWGEIGI
jgi:hypothetical protein